MKYFNIECQRFSVENSSSCEESHIELVVEADESDVLGQFTTEEIVGNYDLGAILDEIGLLIALEHFAGIGGMTVEDFKMILERAK